MGVCTTVSPCLSSVASMGVRTILFLFESCGQYGCVYDSLPVCLVWQPGCAYDCLPSVSYGQHRYTQAVALSLSVCPSVCLPVSLTLSAIQAGILSHTYNYCHHLKTLPPPNMQTAIPLDTNNHTITLTHRHRHVLARAHACTRAHAHTHTHTHLSLIHI